MHDRLVVTALYLPAKPVTKAVSYTSYDGRAFLKTLDQRNLSNGAAEMLKMACIKDAPLFTVLEAHGKELIAKHFQSAAASVAMRRSVQGMVRPLHSRWRAECGMQHVSQSAEA